jgi:hypothetical protein
MFMEPVFMLKGTLIVNWYRISSPALKRSGRRVDNPPPSSVDRVKSYSFTPPPPSAVRLHGIFYGDGINRNLRCYNSDFTKWGSLWKATSSLVVHRNLILWDHKRDWRKNWRHFCFGNQTHILLEHLACRKLVSLQLMSKRFTKGPLGRLRYRWG